jgi:hypothetical protein
MGLDHSEQVRRNPVETCAGAVSPMAALSKNARDDNSPETGEREIGTKMSQAPTQQPFLTIGG